MTTVCQSRKVVHDHGRHSKRGTPERLQANAVKIANCVRRQLAVADERRNTQHLARHILNLCRGKLWRISMARVRNIPVRNRLDRPRSDLRSGLTHSQQALAAHVRSARN